LILSAFAVNFSGKSFLPGQKIPAFQIRNRLLLNWSFRMETNLAKGAEEGQDGRDGCNS